MTSSTTADHGVALTERAISSVEADPLRLVLGHNRFAGPWLVEGRARPVPAAALASVTLPGGRALSPSLRRWLAFDSGFLRRSGWFGPAEGADGGLVLTPRPLGEIARAEFGDGWGQAFDPLSERFAECFLLPGGSDSRRVLAVGEPDDYGEHPVLALDIDDLPCIELMYPGLDVYLADTAGVITVPGEGYSAAAGDARYAARMRAHARNHLAGELSEDFTRW
ncbi:hypothetical protein ACFXKJ_12720 [Kitasatospora indigofera]|uniref:hypothetical protein n=1 Tax=Kitasatospora indigofera TaxID=67307 RepID=UPI0036CD9845